MQIAIIGTGYVGLVTGTCLADFGLQVTCVDKDDNKIKLLNSGRVPIYEPGLENLIYKNVSAGRLSFSANLKQAVQQSQVIFIAVGTPSNDDGSADLCQVEEVAAEIGRYLNDYKVIVNKCTVPIGTARKIKEIVEKSHCENSCCLEPLSSGSKTFSFDIISNPEFLREGSAVFDFTHPDKIVIGYESEKARKIMQEIYRPLYLLDSPFLLTTLETAEMIKYACNAFLATKITFINEIANLCDLVGADVHQVAKGMGMDGRISPKFLHPGPGYGGSCFPKDTRALNATARKYDYDFKLLHAVIDANLQQRQIAVEKIEKAVGTGTLKDKTIAVLGLAFKQNTDDIRESPALDIIKILLQKGAKIRCYDPMAMENTRKLFPELFYGQDEYETVRGSDALVILTEWNQFRNLNLTRIKKLLKEPIIVDMRNLYDPEKVKKLGFRYTGIGRN
ncbi:MAG TPA: UDP-glucose/GDP-mannose dehydrogenase family protein [Atribacterota bacterium]|nr:UDP-glucose/GDP-mannose dehydrogenase family protein [Atribacterota bacterium]